jgi:hypothetical protein
MEPPEFTVDGAGAVRLDTARYDAEVGPFLDGTADPRGPADGARWTAVDLRVPARLSGSERDAYVHALSSHLAARGWLDRAFDYTADEPADDRLAEVRARALALHRAAPRVARLVTHALAEPLLGAVDIWCPVVNLLDDKPASPLGAPIPADRYRPRRAAGERHRWYQSCLSHGCDVVGARYFTGWPALVVDAPPVAHRILEWLAFRYDVGGELYYNTVEAYPGGDPWKSLLRHGGNGDGTLFYPGRPDAIGGSTHVPVESIRLKRVRDGLEDLEYLRLLAARAGRPAADALAARVARRTFDWEHDPDRLLEVRAAIARELDRLEP